MIPEFFVELSDKLSRVALPNVWIEVRERSETMYLIFFETLLLFGSCFHTSFVDAGENSAVWFNF